MTVLHIGLHKTGTTSLQAFLRDHEPMLERHGWSFPNGWLQLNCHFELPLAQLRLDRITPSRMRGLDWQSPGWRNDVERQVADYLKWRPRTILSCEELSLYRYPDELARLRAVVGDAQVVVYVRNQEDWLASMRDEVGQYAEFSSDPDDFTYLEEDSWQLELGTRIEAWETYFDRVTAIDYDRCVDEANSIIPSFCRQLGLPVPANSYSYWLNARGTKWDGRVPGTRWSGRSFGDPVVPTTGWQHEYLRRGGFVRAA